MMPTSNKYFVKAGSSATAAAFMMIGLFVGGVITIRVVSHFIHGHIPSKVVECDPASELDGGDIEHNAGHTRDHIGGHTEHTPLLQHHTTHGHAARGRSWSLKQGTSDESNGHPKASLITRLFQRIGAIFPQSKPCDGSGQCLGFSQPCEHGCVRCGKRPNTGALLVGDPIEQAAAITTTEPHTDSSEHDPLSSLPNGPTARPDFGKPHPRIQTGPEVTNGSPSSSSTTIASSPVVAPQGPVPQHHHHVPRQQFLSLGLQTSLAIALHKLPEGFITFATNHANPRLGWSVFLALFIHNITEGFAMCLPLYLALDSRLKAMIWSSLLGGISQPAGAGIAALWIWGAQKGAPHLGDGTIGSDKVSWAVYGGMFAATAGVMTNVALQLFAESLRISGKPPMCISFAIAGMGILGVSFALTAQ
jgi:ZIP family zinc transporter